MTRTAHLRLIGLAQVPLDGALALAERQRAAVEAGRLALPGGARLALTVSVALNRLMGNAGIDSPALHAVPPSRPSAPAPIGLAQDFHHLLFREPSLLHGGFLSFGSHSPGYQLVRKSASRSESRPPPQNVPAWLRGGVRSCSPARTSSSFAPRNPTGFVPRAATSWPPWCLVPGGNATPVYPPSRRASLIAAG
jgi:hypothetical protein